MGTDEPRDSILRESEKARVPAFRLVFAFYQNFIIQSIFQITSTKFILKGLVKIETYWYALVLQLFRRLANIVF